MHNIKIDRCRIKLEMTTFDVLYAMSEGNPGALRVCADLLRDGAAHDPDSALGGLGPLLELDTLRIYRDRIWMLYKDVCGQHYGKMIACLRAVQLGIITGEELRHAIDCPGAGLEPGLDAVVAAVVARLPAFLVDVPEVAAAPVAAAQE